MVNKGEQHNTYQHITNLTPAAGAIGALAATGAGAGGADGAAGADGCEVTTSRLPETVSYSNCTSCCPSPACGSCGSKNGI